MISKRWVAEVVVVFYIASNTALCGFGFFTPVRTALYAWNNIEQKQILKNKVILWHVFFNLMINLFC